jgi:hypothetical protein
LRRAKISKKRAVFGWELGNHHSLANIALCAIHGDQFRFIWPSKAALYLKIRFISKVFAKDLARVPAIGHFLGGILQQEILNRPTALPAVKWLLPPPAWLGIDFDGHSCPVSIIECNLFA